MANIRQLKEGDDVTVFYPQTHVKAVIDSEGNTLDEILENLEPGGSSDAVKYTSQTLTDSQKAQARTNIGAGTYTKASTGIPASDMASTVQASLSKADSAYRREYDSQDPNGLGYLVLDKDASFASQVTDTNTIYEIRYDFELDDDFTMPSGCVLSFRGGKLTGQYTLTGNGTGIDADRVQIFGGGLSFSGPWYVENAPIEWYGAKSGVLDTDETEVALCANKLFDVSEMVSFAPGTYYSTHGTTLLLRGILCGATKGTTDIGTVIRFMQITSNFDCVRVGVANGSIGQREKLRGIEDITINIDAVSGVVGSSALHVGAVSDFRAKRCSFKNYCLRSSEYTSQQYSAPELYSNFAIRMSGASEFVRFIECAAIADIGVYSEPTGAYDFVTFDKCAFACNTYGFASMYGESLTGSGLIANCSFNQGIFGVKWNSSQNVNHILRITSSRFEQLRSYTYNSATVSTSFDYTTNAANYSHYKPTILFENVFFDTRGAIRITGEEDCYISLVSCSGLNLSTAAAAVDVYNAPYTWVECFNCYISQSVLLKVNQATHQVSGIRLRNQQNGGYTSSLSNTKIIPICNVSSIRSQAQVRYVTQANQMVAIPFEQDLASGSKSPFFDRLKLWDNDNKCIGYTVRLKLFAPGVYGEAAYLVKYASSNSVIDATSGTISLIEHGGDDIFESVNTGFSTGKFSLYISSSSGVSIQLSSYNNIGQSVHIVGTIEAYLTTMLM